MLPNFWYIPQPYELIDFEGSQSKEFGNDPNHIGTTIGLENVYSIIFGIQLSKCPEKEDMYVFGHTGIGGYGMKIAPQTKILPCRFIWEKKGSKDLDSFWDTNIRPLESESIVH